MRIFQTSVVLILTLATSNGFALPDEPSTKKDERVSVVVLGIAQDAGFPQAGCKKDCCAKAWKDPSLRRMVSSIAILDHASGKKWIFDCTPDFPDQLRLLNEKSAILLSDKGKDKRSPAPIVDGVFLTHAHIGHYTGLMHLGREVMGASEVPVYGMPRMQKFLSSNGPWSQLVKLKNISLRNLQDRRGVQLTKSLSVTPIRVPHRDEFSETVGFVINGPNKKVLFLPDIDKWSRWDSSIEDFIRSVDIAYLDGTFQANGEIKGRDMSQIPHPFIQESINRFAPLDESERKKVRFIHLNHTNPGLDPNSNAVRQVNEAAMSIAKQGEVFEL